MLDPRVKKLAHNLVNYSCGLQKGEKILIEATDIDDALVCCIVDEVYKVGGYPIIELYSSRIKRLLLKGTTKEHCEIMAKYDAARMSDMNAYIGIRGAYNTREMSDVDGEKLQLYNKLYAHVVHSELRVKKTKWVILRYPTPSFAQMYELSTDAMEDFFFDVCNLDYGKMSKAMDSLVALLNKTDKVRIVGKDTDLSFSIKDIPAVKCNGDRNIPDGEVYTAPVKNSVNGYIHYNAPSMRNDIRFEDVRLVFKDGKIVEATSNHTEKLNEFLDIDAGGRYVGEFAIGVNPFITKPVGDILFDEKISGSIHFTPGQCYDEAPNGNTSALHWDLVFIQTPEFGGGEIYFDGKIIRKDGRFVVKELECLNPENLK